MSIVYSELGFSLNRALVGRDTWHKEGDEQAHCHIGSAGLGGVYDKRQNSCGAWR